MIYKTGVGIENATPQLIIGLIVAQYVYDSFGITLVVTSVYDGSHSVRGLHPRGRAADLRTRHFPDELKVDTVVTRLKQSLPAGFDVIQEKDHIHMEYDPKCTASTFSGIVSGTSFVDRSRSAVPLP